MVIMEWRGCWVWGMSSYLNNQNPSQAVPDKDNGALLYSTEKL